MRNVVIIVQARMTSTRLPGKVLKPVMGRPLLSYQLERLRRVKFANQIVIATTINETDLPLVEFSKQMDVPFFRGSEDDVLSRYYGAATQAGATDIVRITSDCPLIDPAVVDEVIGCYLDVPGRYDYVSNTQQRSYPRGMDTEIFSYAALKTAQQEATLSSDREHVTPFIHRQPLRFRLGSVRFSSDQHLHRWTLDTPEDLELLTKMLEALYPKNPEFSLADALALIEKHPDWALINQHIEQKKE